jgi:hypothetical protein
MYLPLVEFRPRGSRTLVRLAGAREALGISIDSERLGSLLVTEANAFISAVSTSAHLSTTQRQITAHRPGKAPTNYTVSVHGAPVHALIGTPKAQTTVDILRRARELDDERNRSESDDEIWFAGDVDAAQARL